MLPGLCGESLKKDDGGIDRVQDHDHYTGEFAGAAHWQCNIERRLEREHLMIICHNFTRYDDHIFLEELCKQETS